MINYSENSENFIFHACLHMYAQYVSNAIEVINFFTVELSYYLIVVDDCNFST